MNNDKPVVDPNRLPHLDGDVHHLILVLLRDTYDVDPDVAGGIAEAAAGLVVSRVQVSRTDPAGDLT